MTEVVLKVMLPTLVIWSAIVLLIVQTSVPHILPWNKPKIGSEWHPRGASPFSKPSHVFIVNEVKDGWVSGTKLAHDGSQEREDYAIGTLVAKYTKAKA